MIDIDFAMAVKLIQDEIAKEGGKHTYRPGSCVNVERNKETDELVGSCLIGRVLISAGAPIDKFVSSGLAGASIEYIVGTDIFSDEMRFTEKANILMMMVQRKQDDGVEWSLALERAIDIINDPSQRAYGDTF
ncbi:MAG TPA: hypothetical protein VIY48_19090 [Candidatus Paceibacterota bacterium]